jgi:membrane-bound lytic murein transglycosylase D
VTHGDVDAATRQELVEIRSKLMLLRATARKELGIPEEDARDKEDEAVLRAPAVEEIEPQLNADVIRYIDFFTGAGRSTFERWLKRSGRYMSLFREVLKREGLPPDLVHLVFVESGFNVHARSVAAAVGPWQFLRSTGRLFGLTVNQWVDERKDPEKSTVAAARYLKHLYSIFGDWPLALASYNAGEGTVLRAIKRQGTSNYWDLRLPRQTEDYVPQFMAVLAISRDPQKYGFDELTLEDPISFDEIALKGTVDLRSIANLADCSYEEMRLLNPSVLKHAAPSRDGMTVLRVPKGKAEVILRKLEDGVTLPAVDLTVKHRVKRGETIAGIARQYHVDPRQLAASNGIGRKRALKRGMVLTVRSTVKPGHLEPATFDRADPRISTAYVPSRQLRPIKSMGAQSEAEGRFTVTVRRGETLGMIARRHGVTTQQIMKWNRLTTARVKRGTRLKIRSGEASAQLASGPIDAALPDSTKTVAAVATSVPAPKLESGAPRKVSSKASVRSRIKQIVTVRRGETLTSIAGRTGTTVVAIRKLNKLGGSTIKIGQKLKIPA